MAATYSDCRQAPSPCPRILRQRRGRIAAATALLTGHAIYALADSALTLPQSGNFVAGTGAIGTPVKGSLSITQSSARGVIDWGSFSIGSQGQLLINNGAGATLNRVTGGSLSQIDGALTATGSVYLINPNGVVVGPGGKVLTGGGFTASTRDVTTGDFMQGGALAAAGTSAGSVVNEGAITSTTGDVVLIGHALQNAGSLSAPNGTVTLAAGNRFVMTTMAGPAGVFVAPDATAAGDVTETGTVAAAAVALRAAGGNVYTLAGNRSGLITATGTKTIAGEVWLIAPQATVLAGGTITARNADGSGGRVVANGDAVSVSSTARISATGTSGGSVLIGVSAPGAAQMAGAIRIADGASIHAGGPAGGGSIETSGHSVAIGTADIQAGASGHWLIDPIDLTIDTAAAATLVASLNGGTDVTETTTATGATGAGIQSAGPGDILVNAPISWSGSGSLTLNAFNDLDLNAAISGSGALTGRAGGALNVAANATATTIQLTSTGTLTLAAGVRLTGSSGLTLKTSANFINNAGASALSAGTGTWLVYSTDPATDTPGGLTPDFLQYAATAATAPAAGGNGLLYSVTPNLSVTLSGALSKVYDGTTAATFTTSNAAVSGLINSDLASVTGAYASQNAGTDLTVTATSISVTHGAIPVFGYAGVSPSVSAAIGTITRAPLTASIIGDPTKTYDGTTTAAPTSANYQLNGFVAGEGATVAQASTVAYDTPDAGLRNLDATLAPSSFLANSGTSLTNYLLPDTASGTGHIAPAPLRIQGVLATDKVYDQTTTDTLNSSGATLFGVVGSDNVALVSTSASGNFATANVGSGINVAASGFTLSGSAAGNYQVIQPADLSARITPATLTISGVSVFDKVYDGTNLAALNLSAASLGGVLQGDSVAVGSGYSAAFASVDVGTAIPVAVSGVSLSGAQSANYTVAPPVGLTGGITPKPLSVAVIGVPTKTYDGSSTAFLVATNYQITGLVSGESMTIVEAAQSLYDSADAGPRTVTATLTPPDFVPGANTKRFDYALPTLATGPGEIDPAALVIRVVGNPTKTYDGNASASLSSSNYQLSGFLAGDGATVTQTTGTYASANAGVWQVTALLGSGNFTADSGTLLSNYALPTLATGFGTIIQQVLGSAVVNAAITGNPTKTYDGNTVATLTSSDYTLTGFVAGEGATVTQTLGNYASKNAGVEPVTANLASTDFLADPGTNLANYQLPTTAFGTGAINPAVLTAAIIGNPTKLYDGTVAASLTPANFQMLGFAPGEGATLSQASASYDLRGAGARTLSANLVATQFVANTGTSFFNYILPTNASGPGTIQPATLSVPGVSVLNKTYDTTTAATLSTSAAYLFGVVGTDAVTLSTAGASGTFATANVGSGIAVTTSGFTISGADVGNYVLSQPAGLRATITPAPLSITGVTANDKPYDGSAVATLATQAATLLGVLPADLGQVTLNVSAANGTFASTNVANGIAVMAGGMIIDGAQAGNYALSQPGGLTANITPRPLTASVIGNPTKAYDGTVSVNLGAGNYQLSGFVAGQGATLIQSATASYAAADAGPQTVTATFTAPDFVASGNTNLANYALPVSSTGPGTITQAPLQAAIINNPSKIYDATAGATLAPTNFLMVGFVTGQGATVTQTAGTYASANAGSRSVTATLGSGDFTAAGGTNLANYLLPASATGTGTIGPAMLEVVGVLATDRAYNGGFTDTLNVNAAAVSGLLGSDVVNLNSGGATGSFAQKDVGSAIPVTATGFTISGPVAANYLLAQPTGLAADITQATLTLSNVLRVYASTTALPTNSSAYTLSGVFAGDTVAAATGAISGSYADKNVGAGKSVSLTGLALTGAQAADYTISPSVSNAPIGTITPAPLTAINVLGINKVYDATTQADLITSGATLSGLFTGDLVTLSSSSGTGTFNDKNVGTAKPITTAGFSISGADAGNYQFSQPTGVTADITPFTALALTSVGKTYDGTTGLPTDSSGYGLTGILSGDSVQVATGGLTGSYANQNVGTQIMVNVAGLALAGTDAANYSINATASGAIGFIDPKLLNASIIGTPTKTYDGTPAASLSAANFSLTGFVSGEGASVTKTSGTYASANAGSTTLTTSLVAADFAASGGTSLSNYTLPTSASGAGLINPAPLTILGVLATNKVYDGGVADPLNTTSATLSGVISGDAGTVTLGSAGATGTFASAQVGTGIGVTASGFVITGSNAGNYALAQPTGLAADIAAALLSLTSVTKVYDATPAAVGAGVTYTLSGVVGADTVSVATAGLAGSYASKNVGTGVDVSLSGLTLTGPQAGDYSIASSLTNAPIGTVTPAALSITGATALGKAYDGNTLATIDNGAAVLVGVLGSDAVTPLNPATGTFASAAAGLQTVTVNGLYGLSGTDAGNYTLIQPTGFSATISRAPLTVALVGNPTKTYDGTDTAALSAANYSLAGFVAGQGAVVGQSAGSYDSAHAGTRIVTTTLTAGDFTANGSTDLANYILPSSVSGTGTIDPKTLTVSIINNPSKTFDGLSAAALTSANYALNGLIPGESATITQTGGAYDSINAGARTVTANLAAADFTAGGSTDFTNYLLPTVASGPGAIIPKTLTVSIIGTPGKTYDGTTGATLTAANYLVTGLIGTDGGAINQTTGSYDSANAGVRTVTATFTLGEITAAPGTLGSNYILPLTASGAGEIDPAPLTAAIIGNPSKIYDGLNTATLVSTNYALSGFVSGQGATITQSTGTYDSINAGSRSVTAGLVAGNFTAHGGTLLGNYVLPTAATGSGTIGTKALTVTIVGDPTRSYDGTTAAPLTAANYQVTGFVGSDDATINQTVGSYDSSGAGAHTVTATFTLGEITGAPGTLAANYTLPFTATGPGTIDPKQITAVIVGNPTKTYDGSDAASLIAPNFALLGFAPGEGASVAQSAGTYASADAGTRVVTAPLSGADFAANSGTNFSNYLLPATAAGPGSISPKTLYGAIVGLPTKSYDGTATATLDPSNYLLSGFLGSDSATLTQTTGSYDSANAGVRTVNVTLADGGIAAGPTTNLANYSLPTTLSGPGQINPLTLTAAITGTPTREYNGTSIALLAPDDFTLTGFIAGQSATITQASGLYAQRNAGASTVTASLSPTDFLPARGTGLANYILPASASGAGDITPKPLTAAIVDDPIKLYDGTTPVALTPSNFLLSGFVTGEGATILQSSGNYDAPDPGPRSVTALLTAGDYAATRATDLANYLLPTVAIGPGTITAPIPGALEFAATAPQSYLIYPSASTLSTLQSNGLGLLPAVVLLRTGRDIDSHSGEIQAAGGPALMSVTGQILLQSTNERNWRIITPAAGGSVQLLNSAQAH